MAGDLPAAAAERAAQYAALGLSGPAIGAAQRRLAAHILAHPEDNTREKLLALVTAEQAP